jgi:integrase
MSHRRYRLPALHSSVRLGLNNSTYTDYRRGVERFLEARALPYSKLVFLRTAQIDRRFASYLRELYDNEGSMQSGENARNGLHLWLPRTKNRLRDSHTILHYWARQRKQQSYPPIPRNVATLVAVSLAQRGELHAAIAVLLSFDCYLRVNECLSLTKADVTIPTDRRLGGDVHEKTTIHLRKTKTLDNLSCVVHDPVVARLLHRIVASLPTPASRLFPLTLTAYREHHFKGTLRGLGLGHLHFVPHSLRHGGATHDYVIAGMTPEYIVRRGRWASPKSADRYIQQLRAVDMTFLVPAAMDQQGARFQEHLEAVMDNFIGDVFSALPPLSQAVSDRRL